MKYQEAVPLLEFTSEKPTVTREEIREQVAEVIPDEMLKPIAEKLHMPIEQVRKAFREKGKAWLDKALKETATDGGCHDGEHCQRLASEDELPKLLAEGWHASLVLPSGKVVVER